MKNQPLAQQNNAQAAIKYIVLTAAIATATALLTSCVTGPADMPSVQDGLATIKGSFAERGIAKLDRLEQTEIQKICSEANATGQEVPIVTRERIEKTLLKAIPYPADGQYLGDWKEGEKIAQNGRGLQFSDVAGVPNGANCYACHQITPQEISYGNQGPSLLKYGSLRGVKDPASKDAGPIVKYTWARIWNTHSMNLCSNMPRFGDAGILTPAQVKDVMALLLSPESPINK